MEAGKLEKAYLTLFLLGFVFNVLLGLQSHFLPDLFGELYFIIHCKAECCGTGYWDKVITLFIKHATNDYRSYNNEVEQDIKNYFF